MKYSLNKRESDSLQWQWYIRKLYLLVHVMYIADLDN